MTPDPPTPRWRPYAVVSSDGSRIVGHRIGCGPALLVIHGALESSESYRDLATLLAPRFAVYVPDRRGRGGSGPHRDSDPLAAEIDDVAALLALVQADADAASGARRDATSSQPGVVMFGVSSGGVIVLHAAARLRGVREIAVYEPSLTVPGSVSDDGFVEDYERAISRGETAEALLAVLRGTRMGPAWLRHLPRPIAVKLLNQLATQSGHEAGTNDNDVETPAPSIAELAPTMHDDFQIERQGSATLDVLSGIEQPTLLLGGARSPRYLRDALVHLDNVLPRSRRVQIPRVGHTAASNRTGGGRPDLIADALADGLAFPGLPTGPAHEA